jgi:hypothetical protein
LTSLGLDADGASVADLERALESDPAIDLAVAEALGRKASTESGALARKLESRADERHDKLLKREARRALYRLEQRGVEARPEPPPSPPAPVLGAPAAEASMSIADPAGNRLFWILKPRPGGGLFHLNMVVHEPLGLVEAVLAEVSRKGIRELEKEIARKHGLRMVPVDWRYADWIAAEGYERTRRRGALGEATAHYHELRLKLFPVAAAPAPSPIESVAELISPPADALAASAALFEEEDLRFWFVPEAALAPYLGRYHEMRSSPIVLDRAHQLGRIEEIVGEAVRELFSGDAGASWRRRLEEASYALWRTGRRDAAVRAAAAARALAASAEGGQGIPFCQELVRRTFGVFMAEEAEKEREERAGSVIVTPDQLREEQARRRR